MSKAHKVAARSRMSPAVIKSIVDEIGAYGRSEREEPLSWAVLVKFSGFSRISLWAKPAIKGAFQNAQEASRSDATPAIKAARTTDERIRAMQQMIEELRSTLRAYDERWALHEYNMHRLGHDPNELRRPMDSLARIEVRARPFRGSR